MAARAYSANIKPPLKRHDSGKQKESYKIDAEGAV